MNDVKNSIIAKLALIALVITTMVATVAYYRVTAIGGRDAGSRQTLTGNLLELQALQGASMAFKRIGVDMRDSLLFPQRQSFYENRITKSLGQLESYAKTLEENASTPELAAQASSLLSDLVAFYEVSGRTLTYSRAQNVRATTALLLAEFAPLGEKIDERIQLIETKLKGVSDEALASLLASAISANRATIFNVFLSVLMLTAVISYVYFWVVRPMIRVKSEVGKLAEGDLTSSYQPLRDKSEIGDLSRAVCLTVINLRGLVAAVQGASTAVASKAQGLSSSITEVATGNSSQVGISKEITQTLENLAGATQEIAANAQSLASSGMKAKDAAQVGTVKIGKAIETLKTVQESVLSLSSVSAQIGSMASAINDIADQTNLLALNAAIEAARAGEHGRGFAVVADAVRNLAEQSRHSTREIRDLTATVLKQIDGAIALSTEGAAGAKGAQDALANITSRINDIALTVEGISAASEEQAAAASEVAASMDNFGGITHQVAVSSRESAKTSQQLSDLATELQRSADRFRM